MKNFEKRRKAQRSGFTLIELVMVVMILAIVAGLAVPIVGWLRRSANYASQSHNQAALASNLEFFRTTYGNNNYPSHMDSLLKSDGTEIDYVDSGLGRLIISGTVDGDHAECLEKWCSCLFDHDATGFAGLQGNPGNSANNDREIDWDDIPSGGVPVALLDTTPDDDGDIPKESGLLLNELYGDADEWLAEDAGATKHVIMGIGPRNDAVGTTMQAAPMDSRVDASQVYGRFSAVFAVYSPRKGRRAQLKAVVNAKGRTANNALSEFWQSTNPE